MKMSLCVEVEFCQDPEKKNNLVAFDDKYMALYLFFISFDYLFRPYFPDYTRVKNSQKMIAESHYMCV